MEITLKRAYDAPDPTDGVRVLVDRLWPRGISKTRLQLDSWAKEAAPSAELRREWHGDPRAHDPAVFAAFAAHYREELTREPALGAAQELARLAREVPRLTLVYGAKDPEQNHAVVLRDALIALTGT